MKKFLDVLLCNLLLPLQAIREEFLVEFLRLLQMIGVGVSVAYLLGVLFLHFIFFLKIVIPYLFLLLVYWAVLETFIDLSEGKK